MHNVVSPAAGTTPIAQFDATNITTLKQFVCQKWIRFCPNPDQNQLFIDLKGQIIINAEIKFYNAVAKKLKSAANKDETLISNYISEFCTSI